MKQYSFLDEGKFLNGVKKRGLFGVFNANKKAAQIRDLRLRSQEALNLGLPTSANRLRLTAMNTSEKFAPTAKKIEMGKFLSQNPANKSLGYERLGLTPQEMDEMIKASQKFEKRFQ